MSWPHADTANNAADCHRQIAFRHFEQGLGWEDVAARFVGRRSTTDDAVKAALHAAARRYWREFHRTRKP